MIALMKEVSVSEQCPSRSRFSVDLWGNLTDEAESPAVRCRLRIARAQIDVDIPSHLLSEHRRGRHGAMVLYVPGEHVVPVESMPLLSEHDEQWSAREWQAEMEDFDRF
jgi:hypothetical protein